MLRFLLPLLGLALLVPLEAAAQSFRVDRSQAERWLRQGHEKVAEASAQLLTITKDLEKAVRPPGSSSLPEGLRERIHELAARSRELRQAVEETDVYILSVDVVETAHRVREEAKLLRQVFEENREWDVRGRLRRLAREAEKRADSIYDRTRNP
ncbi:MAG: hypothetical protein L0Z62_30900 [Gemmataceae bacterium]|nr:hypothetical protein [Gemmataceae bacterium]